MVDLPMTEPAEAPNDLDSPLVDLSGLPFEKIAQLPQSALGFTLRRLHEVAERPDRIFTADYQDLI